jgi:hypothetical protein
MVPKLLLDHESSRVPHSGLHLPTQLPQEHRRCHTLSVQPETSNPGTFSPAFPRTECQTTRQYFGKVCDRQRWRRGVVKLSGYRCPNVISRAHHSIALACNARAPRSQGMTKYSKHWQGDSIRAYHRDHKYLKTQLENRQCDASFRTLKQALNILLCKVHNIIPK